MSSADNEQARRARVLASLPGKVPYADRSRRRRPVRALTIPIRRKLVILPILLNTEHDRPQTRADCVDGLRPCPFVGCRYHLAIDFDEKRGSIKFNFPDVEPEDLEVSCALDVADAGGVSLDACGALLNVTRERARQIEEKALSRLKRLAPRLGTLADQLELDTERT